MRRRRRYRSIDAQGQFIVYGDNSYVSSRDGEALGGCHVGPPEKHRQGTEAPLVVRVGSACIEVRTGFTPELLRSVVQALS